MTDIRTVAAEVMHVPIGVYLADEQVAGTKMSRRHMPRSFAAAVGFCTTDEGKVWNVKTAKPTGDAKLDAALCEAVSWWRFKPVVLADGRRVEACSTVTFQIVLR